MLPYLVLDIENDNSNKYNEKAGNFLYDKIVAIGLKTATKHLAFYHTDLNWEYRLNFLKVYNDGHPDKMPIKLLVGHHLTHDLLFLWKESIIQDWIKAGGQLWDTQIVEYILTGQQNKYAALRDLAVNKYNCKEREKLMEPYWEQGIQTSTISKDLVITDVRNDVLDTETIFLAQYDIAERQGLLELIQSQMDLLLATIEMKFNGIKTDKDILLKNKSNLEQQLIQKQNELNSLINKYWVNK